MSAFYQSFGQTDGTAIGVTVSNYANLPFCNNPRQASDGQFSTGTRPPYKRNVESVERNGTVSVGRYEYETASGRTILSLTGPLAIGEDIFIPNDNWQTNPKAAAVNDVALDGPNDDCTGSAAQLEAASRLSSGELGVVDTVVQAV